MTYSCKLCGRTFTGDKASFALRGHISHCKAQCKELELSLLNGVAEIARTLVGERYVSGEPIEAMALRCELDKLAKWRKAVRM